MTNGTEHGAADADRPVELAPAAQRALAEAAARRRAFVKTVFPPEQGGQKGPEPTRYGDWEKNGRATDF